MNPGDAVVAGDHDLLADAPDLDGLLPTPHAQGFDRQELSAAGTLGNVTGRRQFRTIEIPHHLAAGVGLPGIGQENRLMDDRAP